MKIQIFIILFILYVTQIYTQVKLQPEIGFSYMPYKIYSPTQEPIKGNSIDFYFGVNGNVKFSNLFFMDVRVGSALRRDAKIKPIGINSLYLGSEYKNKELNMDLTWGTKFIKSNFIGAGFGVTHKLNSIIIENYRSNIFENSKSREEFHDLISKWFYAVNITYTYSFSIMDINIRYFRTLNRLRANSYYATVFSNPNRVDIILSFNIFNKKKDYCR